MTLADEVPAEEERRDTLAMFLDRWFGEVAVHHVRPTTLATQLGHSSIATTNDIYDGYLEDSRRQASAIMGRVLAGVAER